MTHYVFQRQTFLPLWFAVCLSVVAQIQAAESVFESRTWTDRLGNQLTATFVDAKNGEAQFKNDAGEPQKFKLADFSEPDQKYLRELAAYNRKKAAGEKPELPVDPAKASLDVQPRQTITEPVADMPPYRRTLFEFPVRIWTDDTGKKIQAKLVTAYNDKVVIDVKGTVYDLLIHRISPEDQQYVATQLKGLQRSDLVNVLAKAVIARQRQPDGSPAVPLPARPMPVTVASNNPPPTGSLGTDDIRARLEQLRAQRSGNPDTAPQVATAPLNDVDIRSRLAAIRQQKGEPEPEFIPAPTSPSPASYTPSTMLQEQHERMERMHQESLARMHRPPTGTVAPPMTTQVMVKKCGNCGRVVPDSTSIGDSCPGCGVHFSYDETNIAGSIGYRVGQGLGVLVIVGLVIAGFRKLFG
jgi:hypothetical protein